MRKDRKNFGIIGFGPAGKRHKKVIEQNDLGKVEWIYDPYVVIPTPLWQADAISGQAYSAVDYVVIASPNYTHEQYIEEALAYPCDVIVEKPLTLPWGRRFGSDRINVMMQYRYVDLPFADPSKIVVTFVRNKDWWASWKGNPELSGGLVYSLHIHYIDLALRYKCDYEGYVIREGLGHPHRTVMSHTSNIPADLYPDQDELYRRAYMDILTGGGIKPQDLAYLNYVCDLLNARVLNQKRVTLHYGEEFI